MALVLSVRWSGSVLPYKNGCGSKHEMVFLAMCRLPGGRGKPETRHLLKTQPSSGTELQHWGQEIRVSVCALCVVVFWMGGKVWGGDGGNEWVTVQFAFRLFCVSDFCFIKYFKASCKKTRAYSLHSTHHLLFHATVTWEVLHDRVNTPVIRELTLQSAFYTFFSVSHQWPEKYFLILWIPQSWGNWLYSLLSTRSLLFHASPTQMRNTSW